MSSHHPRVLNIHLMQYSASFFDATLDNTDFEGADLTLANVELAQFKGANFKNVVAREMYVVGTTLFEGIASIENRSVHSQRCCAG